jgi:hypothetical protein
MTIEHLNKVLRNFLVSLTFWIFFYSRNSESFKQLQIFHWTFTKVKYAHY